MNLRTLIASAAVVVLASATAAESATPPKPPEKQQQAQAGAGGDGGAKPKAAAVVIEEDATSNEVPPPAPIGDEKNEIGAIIRRNAEDVAKCYEKALERRPALAGKLVARFDIGPSGKVIGAAADGIPDRELVMCVVGVVRKWEFAKPASGGKLRVAYPFKFEPVPTR